MLTHRFLDYVEQTEAANRFASPTAFMPCPMFQAFSHAQQSQIQDVYRLAAELTREQMRPITYPQFSLS